MGENEGRPLLSYHHESKKRQTDPIYSVMKIIILLVSVLTISMVNFSFAADVPLRLTDKRWQNLKYTSIEPNTLIQLDDGIKISVRESNSPLIYVFDKPQKITSVNVTGYISDLPVFPDGKEQGEKGLDDFALRFGLVLQGRKRLNFAQKLFAAKWVKTLFNLAPPDTGIDHVLFLDLANPEATSWQQRDIKGGKGLMKEQIVNQINANEPFTLDHTFDHSLDVLAFWISSDGDDSKSIFEVTINSISYN